MMSPAQFALQQAGFTVPDQAAGAPGNAGFVSPTQFAQSQGMPAPMMGAPTGAKRPRMEGPASGGSFSSLEQLREEVKKVQRQDPNAREQWISWCDQYGEGRRDPSKHTEEFLQTFLGSYRTGMRLPQEAEGVGMEKVTKLLQRRSRQFKDVWAQYCQVQGGGKSDPMKHQAQYHIGFYDFLAASVFDLMQCIAQGNDISEQISEETPLVKRLRLITPLAGSGAPVSESAVAVPGVAKDALVAQIKAYQRMGPEQREHWEKYCDTNLRGVRDPNRHGTDTLLQFALSIVEDGGDDGTQAANDAGSTDVGTASARWKRATEAAGKPPPVAQVAIDTEGSY